MDKYKKLQSIGNGSNGNNVLMVKNIENGEVNKIINKNKDFRNEANICR